MTAVLGVSTGAGAISLVLVVIPEYAQPDLAWTPEQFQTIPVTGDPVQTLAECIGVAWAANPEIVAIGICLSDPTQEHRLTEAMRHEGITNFRIVDQANSIAAYHRQDHHSDGFASAATVLTLGAGAYAYRKGPVRGVSQMGRPHKIPGGPVAADANPSL